MSTRAIIGFKRIDGTVVGVWNWNDGFDIEDDLIRDFKTLTDVNFLLKLGMFNNIYSQEEYEDFVKWAKSLNIDISDKIVIKHGQSIVIQEKHHIGRSAVEYKNMEDVLGQDINIAYIFENGAWKTYSYRWDQDNEQEEV